MIRQPLRALVLLCLSLHVASATEFFVASDGSDTNPGTESRPFASLARARDAVRSLPRPLTAPVTVRLAPGRYPLTHAIAFGPEDSGSADCAVTYVGAGDAPTIIDGGRRITGWRRYNDRLWVTTLPEVASGNWTFRQLYVGGERRPRARKPNEGFLRVASCPEGTPKSGPFQKECRTFVFAPGDLRRDWKNLQDAEVIVYHFWTDSHLPIESIDDTTHTVTFAHPSRKVFTDDFSEDGARYVVENVFEELDAPGEWYLNRHTGQLFYYPRPGEDPSRLTIVAPAAAAFLRLEGNAAQKRYVSHLNFRNLSFTCSRFELPPGNSNDRQGSASVPAAITLKAAQACAIEHCTLTNLGTYAIELMAGCQDDALVGNEISQVAAGGIRVNGGTEQNAPWERTRGIQITDNAVHDYGLDYPSAVGVLAMNTEESTISHNLIHHGGYTGISLGWVWGYTRSVSQNNRIEYNYIHHIGGVLSDMGGIYTLGVSPGTAIRNNLIHDVDANLYGGWGIYNDEGSTHIVVENNVVHHTKFAPYDIHYAKELTVRNNIFALGQREQLSRGRAEPHKSVYFENNIVYWREGPLFNNNWRDVPYTFHVSGIHPDVTMTSTFDADWNLYFNPTLPIDQVKFGEGTWAEWRKRGKDVHSIYADPKFVAPEQGDFTLRPDSPAFALGFRAIDLTTVGPRQSAGVLVGGTP